MSPTLRPGNPNFGSGPTAKRPGWSLAALEGALLGRSHRAAGPKGRLVEVIERSRAVLGIPADYRVGILGGSDTGAFEAAMWGLLGARGVDVVAFESFGDGWSDRHREELELTDMRSLIAPYGELPDLARVDPGRDVVFCWNGTTSGVRVPDGDWIADQREGLTLCDATSAAFAMHLPWPKLDVVTWSWQKVLGGEAQHGMLVLSPRAVARLESHKPAWPMPKLFRLTKGGKLIEGIFKGETINTPSMLAVEDALDGLRWAEGIGGLPALVARCERSLAGRGGLGRADPMGRVPGRDAGLALADLGLPCDHRPGVHRLVRGWPAGFVKDLTKLLADERAAYDIQSYRDAPAGLRSGAGPRSRPTTSRPSCPGSTGPSPDQAAAR